jgi:hypothetical protein
MLWPGQINESTPALITGIGNGFTTMLLLTLSVQPNWFVAVTVTVKVPPWV